jgi:hypothetical protein
MKMNSIVNCLLLAVSFLAAAFITGCATAPPVDWDSRVGHYTYAQAVKEFGPPNRKARLSNGTTEFKWFQPNSGANPASGSAGFGPGTPYNNMNNGVGTGPAFDNRYLELTFDANGVLTAWSKNY